MLRWWASALFALLANFFFSNAKAQEMTRKVKNRDYPAYIFRVTLCDKQGSPYSVAHPSRFLSRRSVERRKRQQLAVDSTDLPVSTKYLKIIENKDARILGCSKWNNTVLVLMRDTVHAERLRALPCISGCKLVWQAPDSITHTAIRTKYHEHFNPWDSVTSTHYGRADKQIRSLNGHRLHDIGFLGEGIWIAVLDGGFKNADRIPSMERIDVRGSRDFVFPPSPSVFYEQDHGTKVLSTMAVCQPFQFVGTAPKASYWLMRCEDQQTEQEVEEDYWAMAVEYADSLGCDIVNSSLGYHQFDHGHGSHQLWQLDGQQTFISHTASMVAHKGMVLVNSAGNTGMGPWKKLTPPADAHDCLTVGAVTPELTNAPFAAVGPTQDGRIKPDVVAIGSPAAVVTGRGTISHDMGTSFSTPVVCGMMACLWQALPHLTALQLMDLVRQTSDQHSHPTNITGYGMPNFWRAYMIGKKMQHDEREKE